MSDDTQMDLNEMGTITPLPSKPKIPPYTPVLMAELTRCRKALQSYIKSMEESPDTFHNTAHSAAYRASLDLTKCLANWRKIAASDAVGNNPK